MVSTRNKRCASKVAGHLDAHLREKFDYGRLEQQVLRVCVHDAKLVDGAQVRFGSLGFFLLFEQLPESELRNLP
jgi:hypothetical protein